MSSIFGFTIPLSVTEKRVRNHAILSTVGFLILLPVGVLVARYTRTLPYKWFWAHSFIQLIISGPVIFAGWALGHRATTLYGTPHYSDPHEKMGLALLILYLIQIFLGTFAHYFKFTTLFRGYRPPHSYLHAVLGLVIFACAQWQVHYGLFTEWTFATGGLHQVPESAKHAWLALLIVFWVLYALGLALIPKQFKQEAELRQPRKDKELSATDASA